MLTCTLQGFQMRNLKAKSGSMQIPYGMSVFRVLTSQAQWELFLGHEMAELRRDSVLL